MQLLRPIVPVLATLVVFSVKPTEADTVIIGWNDLGMHCMDGSDFSVFSILPPYNTIHAQVIRDGVLVTNSNTCFSTYKAVADPNGSINRTSSDKINFWNFEDQFFGVTLDPDQGLAGFRMPGTANTPQHMHFGSDFNWFSAEGIPISPYDDAGLKNYYPMFQLEARDTSSNLLTATDIVLPVSDELHCSACHHSGGSSSAKPDAGWVWDCNPDHDYKLNILRLHDEYRGSSSKYATALSNAGYHADGLYATVRVEAKPVLCEQCHRSNALPGLGQTNITYFTSAIHDLHAYVRDPDTGLSLENTDNRTACYRCHPGSATRCLRGAMGKAVAGDGTLAMSCQSCHGPMSAVGNASREGWFDEPNCQSCHTGTAIDNNGQIRYTSVFTSPGVPRAAVNQTFATTPNTPLAGKSLYRFSSGHATLQCAACHGSTHAIYPSSHGNDNVQNEAVQGHAGTLAECIACHGTQPATFLGGPHGMHPVGVSDFAIKHDGREAWHHSQAGEDGGIGVESCRACHGADYRGTVLSRAHADRIMNTGTFGTKRFWRGQIIGCYTCHNGPTTENGNPNIPPAALNVSASTSANTTTNLLLIGSDTDPLTWRIVSQPDHGTVGLSGIVATYTPFEDYVGPDTFTFAASDGDSESNLATGMVSVTTGTPVMTCTVVVPATVPVYVAAPFRAHAELHNTTGSIAYAWFFGDGVTAGDGAADACHAYCTPGPYVWTSVVTAAGNWITNSGTITVTDALTDEDGDTVGDYWELAWFGRLGAVNGTSDSDLDGSSDRSEWQSGTRPTDSGSFLRITNLLLNSEGQVEITWTSVSNRTYSIARGTNLTGASMETVNSNLIAHPPANVHTDAPPTSMGFYRVGTSLQSGCPVLP